MTPNSKDPRFIRYDVPIGASENIVHLFKEYQTLKALAQQDNWSGVNAEDIKFEYSTYDSSAEIFINIIDENTHSHSIKVAFYGDDISTTCWISYLFRADNFDKKNLSVQSFAECLMIQLWDYGIDADLCNCDWGLEFTSSVDTIAQNVNILLSTIVLSIKPMDWFYSNETIWKFYTIHSHLLEILPYIKQEAESGRWNKVKPDKFTILRDKSQAYIVLTYQETGIYDMTFKVGFNENGFDSDVTGEWLTCEYNFKIYSSNQEIRDYYLNEQKQCCKLASTILDIISHNALFAYDQEDEALTLLVERQWAFQKYCLLLDVMLPIIFKYEASKPLVTKDVLEQKAKLEILLNTSMEIVEGMDGKHLFAKGRFLSAPEDPNIIYNEEMPF